MSATWAALQLDVTPAWDGNWRHGAATEITVGLLSDQGGEVRISIGDRDAKTINHTVLDPDVASTITVPVRPARAAIEIVITFGDRETIERTVDLRPRTDRIAAIVSSTTPAGSIVMPSGAENLARIPTLASALPRTVEAYETIDLLVLDSGVIGRLDDRQRGALGLFVANCGRIVFDGLATAELALLPEQTPCVAGDASSGAAGSNVARTLRPLPGPDELRELATGSSGLRSLVFFFSGYVLVLCILGTTRRRPVTMLSIPVLAASLLIVTGWGQPAEREFIFWAEFDSGARTGRYTALLDVRGKGPGKSESAVPVELGLPLTLAGGTPVEFEYRPYQSTNVLTVHPHLLSRHQFAFASPMEFVAPLTLTLREGKPWIQNMGERPTPAATLAWQGRYFPVPPLESGQRWSPAADSTSIAASEVPIVLRTRTFDRAAVLLDLAPEQVPAPDAEVVNAWLLLRPGVAERSS